MFFGTGNMVALTPLYIAAQTENASSEVTNPRLKTIEESINYLQNEPSGANRPSLEATSKEQSPWSNGTATTTTTKPPDTKLDEDNNENDWTRVDYRSNARKSWRQKTNILRGTAKCESEMLSADIHLVVYGLAKRVTSLQLFRFIESKDIKILGDDIFTKYEGARSLSFKITIRSCGYEKMINSDIWPVGVGIRQFKFFPRRDGENVNDSQRNKTKSILQKQVNNTNQIETYRRYQNDIRRQYVNSSGMQNSMQEILLWQTSGDRNLKIFLDRFDLTALSHMIIMFKYGHKNVYLQ